MPRQAPELPAVLFDLDGTLIDSVYEHVSVWWDTLRAAKIHVAKWKIHRRVGMSGKSFINELLRELGVDRKKVDLEDLEQSHDDRFARAIPNLRPLPGAERRGRRHRGVHQQPAVRGDARLRRRAGLLRLRVPNG